jgi:hypothetical protein
VDLLESALSCARSRDEVQELLQMLIMNRSQLKAVTTLQQWQQQ